ncbi:MAG: TnpV protein [Lachnospiraceae bacterium]|nr:TnpV protein [Lachnospiraceae bacterium]
MDKFKKHIYDENNGLHYILVGDYYILDLKLPEENRPIGHYGRLHRDYLKEEHPSRYRSLVLTGKCI